jgi:hypothetical protein
LETKGLGEEGKGRKGEKENGRMGERENGRMGEWEKVVNDNSGTS